MNGTKYFITYAKFVFWLVNISGALCKVAKILSHQSYLPSLAILDSCFKLTSKQFALEKLKGKQTTTVNQYGNSTNLELVNVKRREIFFKLNSETFEFDSILDKRATRELLNFTKLNRFFNSILYVRNN